MTRSFYQMRQYVLLIIGLLVSTTVSGMGVAQKDDIFLARLKSYAMSQYNWELALDVFPGRAKEMEAKRVTAEKSLVDVLEEKGQDFGKDLFPRVDTPANRKAWKKLEGFVEEKYGLCFISSFYPRFDVPDKPFSSFFLCEKLKEENVQVRFGDEIEKLRYLRIKEIYVPTLRQFKFGEGEGSGVLLPNILYVNEGLLEKYNFLQYITHHARIPFDAQKSAAEISALHKDGPTPKAIEEKVFDHLFYSRVSGRNPSALVKELHLAIQISGAGRLRNLQDEGLALKFRYITDGRKPVSIYAEVILDILACLSQMGREELNPYHGLWALYKSSMQHHDAIKTIQNSRRRDYMVRLAKWIEIYSPSLVRFTCDTPGMMDKLGIQKYRENLRLWHHFVNLNHDEIRSLGRRWYKFLVALMYLNGVSQSSNHVRPSELKRLTETVSKQAMELASDKELLLDYSAQLLHVQRFGEAQKWMERAGKMSSVDPELAASASLMQMALYSSGSREYRDIGRAIQAAGQVVEHSSDPKKLRDAYLFMGKAYDRQKEYGKALIAYRAVLKGSETRDPYLQKRTRELQKILDRKVKEETEAAAKAAEEKARDNAAPSIFRKVKLIKGDPPRTTGERRWLVNEKKREAEVLKARAAAKEKAK